ncbi:MAG TPA: tetratricopeptide repeat protein [Acidimicrobiales bacterium]|nr:tetratricopeptide repeat protein [Acidimicrobiales bacterium]
MTVSSRDELEEERDFLLASLRDLEREREAGDLSDRDYQALHDDYTARAAEVLRALERGKDRPAARRDRPRPVRTRRSLGITVVVVVAIAGLTGGALAAFSGQRQAGAPMTGSLPDTPSGRMQQALQLESQGQAAEALKIYDELLRADPRNVQALAYRGWLLKRAGLPDRAMESLDQAVAIDPKFPDAHFFRGMVLYQDRNDPAGAVTEFRLFLSNNPPQEMVPLVEDVLRRAMADAGQPVPVPR